VAPDQFSEPLGDVTAIVLGLLLSKEYPSNPPPLYLETSTFTELTRVKALSFKSATELLELSQTLTRMAEELTEEGKIQLWNPLLAGILVAIVTQLVPLFVE
jgi:hypothetical protein